MSKQLPSDTFCVLPFMHAAVNPGGGFRVCCNSNPQNNKVLKDDGSGKAYRIFKDDVNEMWNSNWMKDIRKEFINGERPETCQRCFREEDAGIRSPRIGYNEKWYKEDVKVAEDIPLDIRYVDLRLGNLCNLKCRMCNPWSSSMWVKDWNKVTGTAKLEPNEPLSKEQLEYMEIMQAWPDRKQTGVNFVEIASTIEEIYLTGGEPTLATSQYALFDYCIEDLKQLAEKRLEPYLDIPKVSDCIKYMWAEDWHKDKWQEFIDYNMKTDELQKGKLLDVCPEFKNYV